MSGQTTHAQALAADLKGTVIEPGGEGWDQARQAFNLLVDQRPEAIAIPADAADVARVVRFAAANGLRVAPQLTGHGATPLGDLAGTVLLKTEALNEARVDPAARSARVGAGARWRDVVPTAAAHGLAAMHGSAPGVGIVGYTLGGGLGWYARARGLAAEHVTAIELVTGDGEQRRVTADEDADLFWALRGGGGNFGVVTALEFELFELARVYAGVLFFPLERAAEVLHAWREWQATVPDEVTSVGRILQFPPFPEVPEPLRGRAFSVVEAVILLDESAAGDLLAPLRALDPVMDTFATVAPDAIGELHMDPPDPVPALDQHQLLGELPPQAIDALVEAAGLGSGSPLISVEIRQLGGAVARRPAGAGALGAIDAPFLEFAVGAAPTPEAAAAVGGALERVHAALAPYEAPKRFLSFQDEACAAEALFDGETLARLRAIKRRVDPAGTIRANHDLAAPGD